MSHLDLLQQAIATLEAQRSTLGDAVVDVSLAALRKQLPAAGGGQGEEQRKQVTVLFADLAGFTDLACQLDPEDVRDLQDAYFAAITPPILVHGGSVEKYVGDAILAVFGVPESHEDDALRAVYAGLDMQQALRELNLGRAGTGLAQSGLDHLAMRIAIHTGLVVSRVAPGEGMFLVSGDTVNVTAHLQETAQPGTVLISDATQKLVAGAFAVRPLSPIHLRGKDSAISIFEVEGVVAPNQRAQRLQSPLVGRQIELRRVQERFVQLRTGRGGVIAISGEAGIGKSRLVAEAKRTVRTLAAPPFPCIEALPRWMEARCVASQAAPPYGLWIDVLHALLNMDHEPSSQAVIDQLDAWLRSSGDGRCKDLLPPLVRLLGLQAREPADDPAQNPEGQRMLLFEAVESVLTGIARRTPLIIACEDLHWADSGSLDLWEHVLPLTERIPLLLIGVFRSEAGPVVQRLAGSTRSLAHVNVLDLQPLSAEHCEKLVRNLAGTDDLPQKLVYRILAQAEGNPFYVEEILRALIDGGVLLRSTSEEPWQVVGEVDGIAIPETILGVLTARIDRLQRDTRYVLQLASVVGRIFARPVLAALAESVDNLDQHLAILQQEELIREHPAVAEREYIFKHELTREATYNGILKRQRRVFHRRAAEALERLFPERRDDLLGLLAYHLEHTEEPSRAIPYLLRAGDRARLAYAHQEAVDAYQRALAHQEAQRDDEGSARTLMRLGLVHAAAFDFGLASKAYEQSFALRSRNPAAGRPREDLPAAPHALRQMWGLEPKDWDPNPTFDYEIPLFSGLLEESDALETVPDIATRWEIEDGGRTYVFHLRDDVCWSDGVPLRAVDFEFAWKRLLDPRVPPMNARRRTLDPSTGLRSADLLHDVRGAQAYHQGETPDPSAVGVRALDPLTLLVELELPMVDFIHVMAHPVAYPVPRHCVERYGDAWCEAGVIVGNGPFVLKRWHARSRADLVRNPRYHGRFGGNLSEVQLQCLPYPTDWPARLELYEADQIDILCLSNWPLAGLELARLRHPGDYRRFPCLNTMAFCFDVRRTPFDDRRVRCAFAHAFDRVAWVREAHGNHVGVATGGFVPPAMAGHSPYTSLSYDPALARDLLAAAGYPGGSGFPDVEFLAMMTPTVRAGLAHWCQKIKEVLGISVRWSVVNWMEYFERLEHNPPHIGIMSWSANTPDPDDYLRAGYRHIQRYFGWQHDRYDRLVDAARQLADSDARLDLYRQADAILVNEAAIMPQMHNPSIFLVKPWIKSYPLSPLVGLSVWTCLKDIVLAPH